MKFGDVDGDRKTDFFVVTRNYDGHVFNHEGRELWSYENEQEGQGCALALKRRAWSGIWIGMGSPKSCTIA